MGGHPNGTSVTHATPAGIPAGHDAATDAPRPSVRDPAPADAAPTAGMAGGATDADGPVPATGSTPAVPVPGSWRGWAVGTRVVVRRRLPEGGFGDVLGDLLEVDSEGVVVATRRGSVRVAASDIALGKPVPPPPPRRAPRAAPSAEAAPDDRRPG